MLPKLEACQDALRSGVHRVRILPALEADVLPAFYQTKIDCGTEVMAS
jgi:acetylglutamate kinase